jgi:cytidylate kinase
MAQDLRSSDLKADGLRGEAMGRAASICSGIEGVRKALLDYQMNFANNPPGGRGAVLDGRDIGTAVCPQADLKIWMTAAPEVRAARRRAENLNGMGYDEILAAIKERDLRETTRAISPLIPAQDAKEIDTSGIGSEQALQIALGWVRQIGVLAQNPSKKACKV